jgi:hypothetical protein
MDGRCKIYFALLGSPLEAFDVNFQDADGGIKGVWGSSWVSLPSDWCLDYDSFLTTMGWYF